MKYPIEIKDTRSIKRITIKNSIEDFLNAFNMERGLIYTLKLLFLKPGFMIRHYLTEGRYKIVNVFRLLIISTTLSALLLNLTDSYELVYGVQAKGDTPEETQKLTEFIKMLYTDWYNLIIWVSIPAYALFSYLFLRKYEAFNYAEHLVIHSFIISISNFCLLVLFSLGYLVDFDVAFGISFIISVVYYFFMFWDVFKQKSFRFFLRVMGSFLLGNALYITVLLTTVVVAMLQFVD